MSQIHCEVTGNGRKTVILIHGFCSHHKIWSPFKQKISKKWQVITPDLPGFGQSELTDFSITIPTVAAQLNAWVQGSSFFKPVLIGHSLGGYVGLSMIDQQPGLYSGIGLFHSTAMPDTDEKKAGRNKVMDFVRVHGVQRYVDSFIPGLYYNRNHHSIAKAHKIALETTQRTFFAYTLAMRDRSSTMAMLGNSVLPALFLAGQYDPILNWGDIQKQSKLCPKGTFYLLSDTAHMGMFEASGEAIMAVNNFLEKIEGLE